MRKILAICLFIFVGSLLTFPNLTIASDEHEVEENTGIGPGKGITEKG